MATTTGRDAERRIESFLRDVLELSSRHARETADQRLGDLEALGERVPGLRRELDDASLRNRLEEFARHRLRLVDDSHEYRQAAREVETLAPRRTPVTMNAIGMQNLNTSSTTTPFLFLLTRASMSMTRGEHTRRFTGSIGKV